MPSGADDATSYQTQRKIVRATTGTLALVYQKSGSSGLTLAISRNGGHVFYDSMTIQSASRWQGSAVIAPNNDIYVAYSTNENGASDKWDVGLLKLTYQTVTDAWTLTSDTFIHNSVGTTAATLATIERDSTGRLWTAYRFYQGGAYSVVVNYSNDGGQSWLHSAVAEAPITVDDKPNGSLLRFGGNKLGLVWYQDRFLKFRWRRDTDAPGFWEPEQTLYQITGSQGIGKGTFSAVSDAAGHVHVLFRDKGLRVVSWNGSTWNTPGVVIETSELGVFPSLSTNGTDLWAVYDLQLNKFVATQITARQYNAATGTWSGPLALSDATTVNTFPSMIHQNGSGPIVVWTRGTSPYEVKSAVVGQIP
jgi:hypothetical protein